MSPPTQHTTTLTRDIPHPTFMYLPVTQENTQCIVTMNASSASAASPWPPASEIYYMYALNPMLSSLFLRLWMEAFMLESKSVAYTCHILWTRPNHVSQ